MVKIISINKNKAIILFSVIVILLTIALIGASLAAFLSFVDTSVRMIADEAKAFCLAEAGVAYAVHVLRTKAAAGEMFQEKVGPVKLGDGSYMVEFKLNQSLITSTGRSRNAVKRVQLRYKAL